MSVPNGSVTILGIPYVIEETDLPDQDDSEYSCRFYHDRNVFAISPDPGSDYTRSMILAGILSVARELMDPAHPWDDQAGIAYTRSLFGALRSNQSLVSYLCGDTDEAPEMLAISGFRWTVKQVPHVPGSARNVHGEFRLHEQTIYIRKGLAKAQERCVLLHETAHAVGHFSALRMANDEAWIRAVSYTLHDVFVNNQPFMKALFGDSDANIEA